MCVDILRANLKDKNKFPLNVVDLDTKIEGTTGKDLCKGSASEKCCECYMKLGVTSPMTTTQMATTATPNSSGYPFK